MSCVACGALSVCECAACLGCACCSKVTGSIVGAFARVGHVLLIGYLFSLAAILGTEAPNTINGYHSYTTVDLTSKCNTGEDDTCIYRQLIYRASFSLFLVFLILAPISLISDAVNQSLWPLKFGVATALFVGFWWGDSSFFSGYAEFARVFSFVWLLFQTLLLVDFAHGLHDFIIAKADAADSENEGSGRKWYILYIILSLGFLTTACVGLAYLFTDYSGCGLGLFFTLVTLITGVLTILISMLNSVNKGFLTPCIMFSYNVFMCWYALLSNPYEDCNPTANDNEGYQWRVSVTVVIVISAIVMMYCSFNGTVILTLFSVEGEGVITVEKSNYQMTNPGIADNKGKKPDAENQNSESSGSGGADSEDSKEKVSGSPKERMFFHVLMILFVVYACMMLTNWGRTNGGTASQGDHGVALESMWFKIASQWIAILMYFRILQLAYYENKEA